MVDLAPTVAYTAKYPTNADGEVELGTGFRKGAALAADRTEHLADDVERVVVELDLHLRWALEDAFMDRANFWPAALYTAKRIVHGNVFRMVTVFRH